MTAVNVHEAILAYLSQWPHELHAVENLGDYHSAEEEQAREPASIDEANVYTSKIAGDPSGRHTVVLDLDVPARLVPSSTPGHSHLYIDTAMTWPTYVRLLRALADAGVIEVGYHDASIDREHTAVRLPWIKKETPADDQL